MLCLSGFEPYSRSVPLSHINKSKILQYRLLTKDLEVRRDLGNRASPINWAHVKSSHSTRTP